MPTRHSQDDDARRRGARSPTSSASRCTCADRGGLRPRGRGDARRCSAAAEPTEVTRQNVQARLRGQRMWNWANSSGALFLQTGDMSEKAVGYTTIGGDLEGALSVIANVPKTVVVALLERLARRASASSGIAATLATEPGPELADAQDGRARADAVPGARRLPAPLRRREDVAATRSPRRSRSLSRRSRRSALEAGRRASRALFTQSIYKWVQSPLAAARRLARSRSRARAAAAGGAEDRVVIGSRLCG